MKPHNAKMIAKEGTSELWLIYSGSGYVVEYVSWGLFGDFPKTQKSITKDSYSEAIWVAQQWQQQFFSNGKPTPTMFPETHENPKGTRRFLIIILVIITVCVILGIWMRLNWY